MCGRAYETYTDKELNARYIRGAPTADDIQQLILRASAFLVCATHFGGPVGGRAGLAVGNLAGPITATSLPLYDALHCRFRQAKLTGNDAYPVTFAMQLS